MPAWSTANSAGRSPDQAAFFNVNHARQIAGQLAKQGGVRGKRVLEIGPGQDLGVALLLRGMGADVTVLDPFPCPWDPYLHPDLYKATIACAARVMPEADPTPLRQAIRQRRHAVCELGYLSCSLEDAAGRGVTPFDHTVSNAVFEHLASPLQAFAALAALTRPGGTGWHQIDFRDHRHAADPLQFLTVPEEQFRNEAEHAQYNFGNRWRCGETTRALIGAGFAVRTIANDWIAPAALRSIRPHLLPRFATLPDEELEILSACCMITRNLAAEG